MIPLQPKRSDARDGQMELELPEAENRHWNSLPVFDQTGSFGDMSESVPQFERLPFESPNGGTPNSYFHVVSRKAHGNLPAVPVGLVSPTYQLIQHGEIFAAIRKAFTNQEFDVDKLTCNATFTAHHERMELRIAFPKKYTADVGDGNPIGLQLCCFNSVDGRSSFALYLGWLRFVCGNGLVFGTTTAKLRKPHRESLRIEGIESILSGGLAKVDAQKKKFDDAMKAKVSPERLRQWIDGPVAKTWGVKAGTRILHVTNTGRDCKLARPFCKAPPSQHAVIPLNEVPGALPLPVTRFSVMQACSWIASHRNALDERQVMTRQIRHLMACLPRS